jgi:hypothetical protein
MLAYRFDIKDICAKHFSIGLPTGIYRWQTMSKGPRVVDGPGTGKIFLNKKLLIFSIFKMTGALIMLTLVGVIPILYTQTAFSQTPQQSKQSLACDLSGHPSCYSSGYSAGLVNKGVSCSSTLLSWAGTPAQVVNYCSGFMAAQQQQLQQQQK